MQKHVHFSETQSESSSSISVCLTAVTSPMFPSVLTVPSGSMAVWVRYVVKSFVCLHFMMFQPRLFDAAAEILGEMERTDPSAFTDSAPDTWFGSCYLCSFTLMWEVFEVQTILKNNLASSLFRNLVQIRHPPLKKRLLLSNDWTWWKETIYIDRFQSGFTYLIQSTAIYLYYPLVWQLFYIFYCQFSIYASWPVLALSFFVPSIYHVYCYAPIYQGKFLAYENLLGNRPDSDFVYSSTGL